MDYLLVGEETERILFRKLTPDDYKDWLPFHQNPESSRYWSGLPKDPDIACSQQFNRVFERYENNLGGMNALICKVSSNLVGLCGLLVQHVDDKQELEIGYSILPKYWGQGFATESAIKCKDVAFKNNWAPGLISIIHVENEPSRKVAIKNGMKWDKSTIYKENPVDIFRIFR